MLDGALGSDHKDTIAAQRAGVKKSRGKDRKARRECEKGSVFARLERTNHVCLFTTVFTQHQQSA
jgi:hypothetical protein